MADQRRPDDVLRPSEVIEQYPGFFTTATLVHLRQAGDGPAHYRLSSGPRAHCRYKRADIESWIADLRVEPQAS